MYAKKVCTFLVLWNTDEHYSKLITLNDKFSLETWYLYLSKLKDALYNHYFMLICHCEGDYHI